MTTTLRRVIRGDLYHMQSRTFEHPDLFVIEAKGSGAILLRAAFAPRDPPTHGDMAGEPSATRRAVAGTASHLTFSRLNRQRVGR